MRNGETAGVKAMWAKSGKTWNPSPTQCGLVFGRSWRRFRGDMWKLRQRQTEEAAGAASRGRVTH
eukprot:4526184-Prymnesium_polylepis.1